MDSRSRKNWRGKTRWAKWAPPLLLAAVAALWLALPTPPAAHAQEATASCGSGPLNGRTQKVVDAILDRLSETECVNVTLSQLTGLTGTLGINNKSLSSLRSDDFDNLSSLERLNLYGNNLTELPSGVFDGLSSLTHLRLYQNDLTTLPDGVFDDLTGLVQIGLNSNQLEWLPPDLFEGQSNLTRLDLQGNHPLACIHASQFDGLSSLDALRTHGTMLGNINPTHFTRWSLNQLTELRLGETLIVYTPVAFADYQAALPALVGADTYVVNTSQLTDPICESLERLADCGAGNPLNGRTRKVVDKIVADLSASDCSAVTATQLAGVTTLNLSNLRLHALQDGDFANFTGLQNLHIHVNKLTTLPSDVFDGLSSVQRIDLFDNELTTLPEDLFDGLSGLNQLNLNDNELTTLPEDLFNGRSSLENLRLDNNSLAALPEDLFNGLSSLQNLDLYNNDLTTLPEDLFDGLSKLQTLDLYNNSLTALPEDQFNGLATLGQLNLYDNSLTTLPADVFDGLGFLNALRLHDNSLAALPEDVFDGLTSMTLLRLNNNSLATLPPDLFDGPPNLRELYLTDNSALACIHPGQFDGLSELRKLHLTGAKFGNIAPTHATRWALNELEELRFGETPIASSTLTFQDYKSEFPDLVESRTYVRDPAELSDPICGAIRADTDGSGFHTIVRVNLEQTSVYPNRVQEASTPGDGICGASTGVDRRKLWTWQRSDDGVTWTDMASARQPKDYGARAAGECSFTYTPQADDNGKHIRAYVSVDTAGVGANNYHSAAFGPLNIQQP